MKIYTIEVVITSGGDEFWEDIEDRHSTGCEEVTKTVRDILFDAGFQGEDCIVTLRQYQET